MRDTRNDPLVDLLFENKELRDRIVDKYIEKWREKADKKRNAMEDGKE